MKFTLPLLAFILSLSAHAQIHYYTPEPAKAEAVNSIITKYTPALIERWKNEPKVRFIDFNAVQGTASAPLNVPTYDFYSGLFLALEPEELVLVTCHETGHLLGTITLRQSDDYIQRNFDLSPESEADYWGGGCVLAHVKEKDLRLSPVDPRCDVVPAEEQEHCTYAINLYLTAYPKIFHASVNPEAAENIVYDRGNGIDFRYGTPDCRALTAVHAITGKARPTCWYNPK
ncbi:MAG: hypothetical protein ACJ76H_03440 [Bacteriovoracaceae bacterium]